ncbi:MAG TPA: sugar phosphate isomerase/epimerase family protein [bacterium]|nr:sugar phosphate isomerase/epimerase family protein [bacterium]
MKLAYAISASPTQFQAVASTDVYETIPALAGLGFDGVELAIRDPAQVDLEPLAAAAERAGVAVPAIGTGQAYIEEGLGLTAPEEHVRVRAVARLLGQVSAARRFGALLIVGLIHGPIPAGTDRSVAEERVVQGLGTVARAARTAGVRLVVEPINRYESNWLNTVDEVLDLLNRLGEDNVGVLPDTFHMNIEEADLPAALRRGGPRVWHVHMADSNRRAPGWGHLAFAPVVQTLREMGYGGFASAEILQTPGVLDAAWQTIGALRRLVPRAAPEVRSVEALRAPGNGQTPRSGPGDSREVT